MKIYAAGWALQSPALNFFKKFLRSNPSIVVAGIIYPIKIPSTIENIRVLDFDDAAKVIQKGDVVVECHRAGSGNDSLRDKFLEYFSSKNVRLVSVSDFIKSLVENDIENQWQFHLDHVNSTDIRNLCLEPPFAFARDKFADMVSHAVASELDAIARSMDWDRMLNFDKNEIEENILYKVLVEVMAYYSPKTFRILNEPLIFLNLLLKLHADEPDFKFEIEMHDSLMDVVSSERLELYRRVLGVNSFSDQHASSGTIILAGGADRVADAHAASGEVMPSIFFMRRSIFDYRTFCKSLNSKEYRVLLRQPDTSPANLIAALLV